MCLTCSVAFIGYVHVHGGQVGGAAVQDSHIEHHEIPSFQEGVNRVRSGEHRIAASVRTVPVFIKVLPALSPSKVGARQEHGGTHFDCHVLEGNERGEEGRRVLVRRVEMHRLSGATRFGPLRNPSCFMAHTHVHSDMSARDTHRERGRKRVDLSA